MAARLARAGPAVAAALLAAVALAAWHVLAAAPYLWAGSVDCERPALAELTGPPAAAPGDGFFDPGPVCHAAAWVRLCLVVTSAAGVALALLWGRRPGARWPLAVAGAAAGAAVLALAGPGALDATVLLWPLAAPVVYLALEARRPGGGVGVDRAVAGALAVLPLAALAVADIELAAALLVVAAVLAAARLARSRLLLVAGAALLLVLGLASFGFGPR